ncbi:MAG: inorganic phosphate transporter [Pyrinomonadaceae bacterium]|nr:inorganic phosphate transporter [Pyrinomonadaceae bacterium]
MLIVAAIFALIVALAAMNGANDVSKGVATLAGSGITRYRTAILWGALTTLAGSLLSGLFATRMLKLFTGGIVAAEPTPAFTLAVICGAAGWVALATVTRLPVSTTHAIIGALIGAALVYAPGRVLWAGVLPKLAMPLLLSIAASYALSATLNRVFAKSEAEAVDCLCVGVGELDAGQAQFTQINVVTGTTRECAGFGGHLKLSTETFHWLSSGAVGFARGLNDTPKLVAVAVTVLGARINMNLLILITAAAMFAGSLYAGRRVARVLAEKVVRMDHREGLLANITTALLVGVGANLGLPMSTTHVSTGAIAGIAGSDTHRLNRRTLRDLVLAWTITPLVAGIISVATYLIAARLT